MARFSLDKVGNFFFGRQHPVPFFQRDREVADLSGKGFMRVRFFNDDHWAAIIPSGSWFAIVDGDRDALSIGYINRWNYHGMDSAVAALLIWDGRGDPIGWVSKDTDTAKKVWP